MFCKSIHAHRKIIMMFDHTKVILSDTQCWIVCCWDFTFGLELVFDVILLRLIELWFAIEKLKTCWIGISFGVHFAIENFEINFGILLLAGPPQMYRYLNGWLLMYIVWNCYDNRSCKKEIGTNGLRNMKW